MICFYQMPLALEVAPYLCGTTRHIRKASTVRLLKKLKFVFKICYFYHIRHTLNYFST